MSRIDAGNPLVKAAAKRWEALACRTRTARRPLRARVFVVSAAGNVALIERRKRGLLYWAVPGGGMEPGDGTLMETALREAEEEIDLSPDLVEVIGELEEMYIPPSDFRVSPFVGLLPPEAELVLHPDEVEEIFTVSLDELMSPETFRKALLRRDGRDYEVPVFAVKGSNTRREIWGATAAMTAALLARLGWKPGTLP